MSLAKIFVVGLGLLCALFAIGTQAATSMTLAVTTRDQSPRFKCKYNCTSTIKDVDKGLDFEWTNPGALETGIVTGDLDIDARKPIYAWGNGLSPKKSIHNTASFDTWFRDSAMTKNVQINLTLTQLASDPRSYQYESQVYFPLNGKGFDVPAGTDQYKDLAGNMQNFHFCNEAHGRFSYKGGEQFSFYGDDDVFVYINNKLALDIGGVHGPVAGAFNLNDIAASFGLELSKNYRFDFFWCERHTLGSDVKITTSLEIYCSYYDWCDQCDGDGQSCCKPGMCVDGNNCTTDLCAILVPPTVSCQFKPIDCPAPDVCTLSACSNATAGCVNTPVVCADDGNKCTLESCSPSRGGCIREAKVCDDGKGVCTTKTCTPGTGACSFANITCNDNNACTTDTCDPVTGCKYTPILCADTNACTIDTCDPSSGCKFTPKDCTDATVCTTDSCLTNGECSHVPINCNDNNACTSDSCDPVNSCQHSPVSCDDLNKCTDDSCSPSSGCSHTATNCDDGDACTVDTCTPGNTATSGCQHAPVTCNDNQDCTYDTCDRTKGCVFTPKKCDDGNYCTTDSCTSVNTDDVVRGCAHTAVPCDDNNKCTNNTCDPSIGCVFQPLPCKPGKDCATAACTPAGGCVVTDLPPAICDVCHNSVTGENFPCPFTDLCKPLRCEPNATAQPQCVEYANVNCNDNNPCTNDTCISSSGQCLWKPKDCDDHDPCTTDSCSKDSGECLHVQINCNDGNNCTKDTCSNGVCSNTLVSPGCVVCGTGSCTTTDYCKPITCKADLTCSAPTPISCDDNNKCTTDACVALGVWNTTCSFQPISCTGTDGCNPSSCSPTEGCKNVPVSCDDSNPCTVDTCQSLNASSHLCHNDLLCPSTDPCRPNVCNATSPANPFCFIKPVNCDDKNPCTTDTCTVDGSRAPQCVNTPIPCPVTDLCFPQTCDSTVGSCQVHPVNCSDGIKCTIDSCDGGVCANLLNPCDDFDNCTTDSCSNSDPSVDGCVHTPISCDDTLCATASCDRNLGCVMTPITCSNGLNSTSNSTAVPSGPTGWCAIFSCDDTVGCIAVTRTCLLADELNDGDHWVDDFPNDWKTDNGRKYKEEDCFTANCDSTQQKCVVSKRDWTGSNCGFLYLSQGNQAAILTAGAIAGVVVAAVVFAALAGFGAKKGYDAWVTMKDERFSGAATNPLYTESGKSGVNPLFR